MKAVERPKIAHEPREAHLKVFFRKIIGIAIIVQTFF